ncbi:MAG: thioredoxin fold domain-containing protein [Alphaproteobacteria bacterium]
MIKNFLSRRALLTFAGACALALSAPAFAQEDTILPELPEPLQNLAGEGAQIRFLGRDFGVQGWIAIKNGQEQYFYVLPGGGFVSGILFDDKGQAVTVSQVSRLRSQSGGNVLDSLATDDTPRSVKEAKDTKKYEFKTPAEQLFWDIEQSNWLPLGQAGTPVLYSFVDPQCKFCHKMLTEMRPEIEAGRLQVRIIPVGYKEETRAQAAYLLATPSPAETWWRHMDGDRSALPAKKEINQQGVQRNLSVMQSWKLDVTPLVVYRGKDQKVKILRGSPKDLKSLIADLGARS